MHIHVMHAEGEAKIWLEPEIELHSFIGLTSKQIKEILEQVNEHKDEIREHWHNHFRQ